MPCLFSSIHNFAIVLCFFVCVYAEYFERAWGWDTLLPVDLVTPLWIYNIYLRQYYIRNHQREGNAAGADDLSLDGDDHGNGLLAALANKVAFCLAPCCPV
jgi:hypothetical protein